MWAVRQAYICFMCWTSILGLPLLFCTTRVTAEQPLCDMSPYREQAPEGVAPCKTCFFPTYPGINSLDLTNHQAQDFTNQWIYFSGDSTLRQVYGEFYGIIHQTQVCATCTDDYIADCCMTLARLIHRDSVEYAAV